MRALLDSIRPTTFIESAKLSDHLGLNVTIASETFQHTGSFKFRAAYNVAINVPNDELIGVSSGNFGQALALAAKLTGKKCTVIMPANSARVKVEISDLDFPGVREVDRKLIELGKALRAKVVTNDANLNKLAELSGVQVLSVHELANALRPVVLPGEGLHVQVLREGREAGQGVAYLDDGTMVVVDHGRKYVGQTVDVTVTSVLQTTAGRMIFSRPRADEPAQGSRNA